MSKILITGFEPFGLVGKYVRGRNSSEDILKELQCQHPEKFDFLLLPVSQDAALILQNHLEQHKPSGVLSMGEHLFVNPNQVKIEPHAINNDTPSSLPSLSTAFTEKIESPFLKTLKDPNDSSSIGTYFCNEVYKTALKWSETNGSPPVAFLHTPVFGHKALHTAQVVDVLEKMSDYIFNANNIISDDYFASNDYS